LLSDFLVVLITSKINYQIHFKHFLFENRPLGFAFCFLKDVKQVAWKGDGG